MVQITKMQLIKKLKTHLRSYKRIYKLAILERENQSIQLITLYYNLKASHKLKILNKNNRKIRIKCQMTLH